MGRLAWLFGAALLAAINPAPCRAKTPEMLVDTQEQAVSIAKAFLKGTPNANLTLGATREGDIWVVKPQQTEGPTEPGLMSLTIDAKTGQILSEDVLDVGEIKPPPTN